MKGRKILDDALVIERFHPDNRRVNHDIAVLNLFSHLCHVRKIIDVDLTGRNLRPDSGGHIHRSLEEVILDVENRNLLRAIECELHLDCGCSSASSGYGHLFPLHLNAMIPEIINESDAIGHMPDQFSILVDNCVHCSDNTGSRRKLIHTLCRRNLVRHGYVHAAHVKEPHGIERLRHILLLHIKGCVDIIQPKSLKTVVVHGRRAGMADRRADQSKQRRMTINLIIHDIFLLRL